MKDKYLSFGDLPKRSQEHLLEVLGLPETETEAIRLRYVCEYSYAEIAAQMSISEKSVGSTLNRAKRHAVKIAKRLYPLADDKAKMLIDELGWRELPWPVEASRRRANRGEDS